MILITGLSISCAGDNVTEEEFEEGVGLPTNITGASLAMQCSYVTSINELEFGRVGCAIINDDNEKLSIKPTESSAKIKTAGDEWIDASITHLGAESPYTFILDDKGQINNIFDATFVDYEADTEIGIIKLSAKIDRNNRQDSFEAREFYIHSEADPNNFICSQERPCNNIVSAIQQIPVGIQHSFIIKVANVGIYKESIELSDHTISQNGELSIIGYDSEFNNEENFTIELDEDNLSTALTIEKIKTSAPVIIKNINIKPNKIGISTNESSINFSNIFIEAKTIGIMAIESSIKFSNISIEGDASGINTSGSTLKIGNKLSLKKLGSNSEKNGIFVNESTILIEENAQIEIDNFHLNLWLVKSSLSDFVGQYSNKIIKSTNAGSTALGITENTNASFRYTSLDLHNCDATCISVDANSTLNFDPLAIEGSTEVPTTLNIQNKEITDENSTLEPNKQILTFIKRSTAIFDLTKLTRNNILLCNKNGESAPGFRLEANATEIIKFPLGENETVSDFFCDTTYHNNTDISNRLFVNNKSCFANNGRQSIEECIE